MNKNNYKLPIFVMITGFFFLKPEKEFTLKKLYKKNILHLVLSVVFWTVFYALFIPSQHFYPFGGQNNHFWYIGMCIGLYVSMPVLRAIAANPKLLSYSCWIWLFIHCYMYLGYFVELPIVFTDYVFQGYMGYCLWGYYLFCMELSKRQTTMVYMVGLLSLLATAFLPPLTDGKVFFSMEDPAPILTSIALFLFVIKHPLRFSERMKKIVLHLSRMTFGIYMAHMFVMIEILTRLHRFVPNVFLLVPIAFIIVFVSSYFIVLVIKQIPFLKKWVV